MTSPGTSRSGKLLLVAVGLIWVVGLALFWTPYSPYFRHWELLREGPVAFRPLKQLHFRSMGDLGRNAWVEALRIRRSTTFTTDAFGLRNLPTVPWGRIVVVGDSYVVGSGLDDTETIPAVLGRNLGESVYNYGVSAHLGPLAYLMDPRSREQPPELVIWAPAFRTVAPVPLGLGVAFPDDAAAGETCQSLTKRTGQDRRPNAWASLRARALRWEERFATWKASLEEETALFAVARSAFHELYYRAASRPWEVEQIEIAGDPALVLTLGAQGLYDSPTVRRWRETTQCIEQLAREVEARGSRFLFAPIPDVGTIYADHYPAQQRQHLASPPFVEVVFDELARLGVACLDLRPGMARERFPYLFQRDDTHLGSAGAELVGRLLAPVVPPRIARIRE